MWNWNLLYLHTTNETAVTKYIEHLTPYAYDFVIKQSELKDRVKQGVTSSDENEYHQVNWSEGLLLNVSTTCLFWKSMKSPCKHPC